MARITGKISEFTEVIKSDSTCKKCGGLGYLKSFHHLPDGGICYRCNGEGVCDKDYKEYTEVVETTKPLNAVILEDDMSFEDLLALRQKNKEESLAYYKDQGLDDFFLNLIV